MKLKMKNKERIVNRFLNEPEENHIRGYLHSSCGFCALGLMADEVGVEWTYLCTIDGDSYYSCGDTIERLPVKVLEKIGIDEKQQKEIFELNDSDFMTFKEIGEHIKKNWN